MHSTDNLEDGYLGSGRRLGYSIRKYGKENHIREILEYLDSREELIKKETKIVNLNEIAKKECMNMATGGHGGFYHIDISEINKKRWQDPNQKEKLLENARINAKKGREKFKELIKNKEFKKKFSRKISESRKGIKSKPLSEEHKQKIGNANSILKKGKGNPMHGKVWIYNIELKKSISVSKSEIDTYLNKGWIKGRKLKF
jgi:hypothetical protein